MHAEVVMKVCRILLDVWCVSIILVLGGMSEEAPQVKDSLGSMVDCICLMSDYVGLMSAYLNVKNYFIVEFLSVG